MKPIREAIFEAIETRVSGNRILSIAGFDPRDLPQTGVVDQGETAEPSSFDLVTCTLQVAIVRAIALPADDATWHTIANGELASLQSDLFSDSTLNRLVEDMQYGGGNIVFASETRLAEIQINASLRYQYEYGNPYQEED